MKVLLAGGASVNVSTIPGVRTEAFTHSKTRGETPLHRAAAFGTPTAVEMLLVGVGAFFYLQPSFGGVAGWLPLLYCCASVGVGAFARWLVDG